MTLLHQIRGELHLIYIAFEQQQSGTLLSEMNQTFQVFGYQIKHSWECLIASLYKLFMKNLRGKRFAIAFANLFTVEVSSLLFFFYKFVSISVWQISEFYSIGLRLLKFDGEGYWFQNSGSITIVTSLNLMQDRMRFSFCVRDGNYKAKIFTIYLSCYRLNMDSCTVVLTFKALEESLHYIVSIQIKPLR